MCPILKDDNTTISFFKEEVREFVRERNWKKFHTPKNLIQALSIEVAELSEIFLFKDYSLETIRKNKEILERLSDEIADVFIYLISLANSVNIDLTDHTSPGCAQLEPLRMCRIVNLDPSVVMLH